jgi:DNA (cytosine-5)-methyltransferase 1
MITHGSLFSGIGGIDLGFERAGITTLWQVEKDNYCNKILAKNFPNVQRHTDITKLDVTNLQKVDIISAGFPCQDISIAGYMVGLRGERSGLFFEAVEIFKAITPKWIVLENVQRLLTSNKGRDFGEILLLLGKCGYFLEWSVFNSQYFGVPQRRKRVFIVGHFGEPPASPVLLDTSKVPEHLISQRSKEEISSRTAKEGSEGLVYSITGTAIGRQPKNGAQRGDYREGGISYTLTTSDRHGIVYRASLDPSRIGTPSGVSRQLEQHFSSRHRVVGNAVTVPVAHWIGERIVKATLG